MKKLTKIVRFIITRLKIIKIEKIFKLDVIKYDMIKYDKLEKYLSPLTTRPTQLFEWDLETKQNLLSFSVT